MIRYTTRLRSLLMVSIVCMARSVSGRVIIGTTHIPLNTLDRVSTWTSTSVLTCPQSLMNLSPIWRYQWAPLSENLSKNGKTMVNINDYKIITWVIMYLDLVDPCGKPTHMVYQHITETCGMSRCLRIFNITLRHRQWRGLLLKILQVQGGGEEVLRGKFTNCLLNKLRIWTFLLILLW